ncbi:MAG TPA: phosphoenolpyruvate--protein phosphotransferase [Acidimicrobiia bacterium]
MRRSEVSDRFDGIGASGGIAIGPAVVYRPDVPEVRVREVADPAAEAARLERAVASVLERLGRLEALASGEAGAEVAEIFEAHRMFLDDPSFSGDALEMVRSEAICAEAAVDRVTDRLATEFEEIGDEYFAARAADVRDIGTQLVRELLGLGQLGFGHLTRPSVIAARDLTPSETMTIPPGMALAFVTEVGSPTSHTAILARSLGIPAVVGVGGAEFTDGVVLAVDGDSGSVWVEPDAQTVTALTRRKADLDALADEAQAHAGEPAVTRDGRLIEVVANIGSPADASRADRAGAEGVGLFRTEFLFIDRGAPPSEEEQYRAYREVFETFGTRPVVVRTLDVGGDKEVPGIDQGQELNPFLGVRGIRLTLAESDLFRTQLRALLRAAVGANLKLMFPMVATLEEIDRAREAVDAAAASLDAEGAERADDFEIGIMIEVPSAAVTADLLAPHVDFFSIGTNDLTQYTLAVDRTNPAVAPMADALHPAVLRLIGSVIDAAHAAGKWVGLCGELAGDPLAAPVLLGLGLDEWSMNPPSIGMVKARVRTLSGDECRSVAARCLGATSARQVREILEGL